MLPAGVTVDPMGLMIEIGMGLQRQMDFRNEVATLHSVARVLHDEGVEGVVIPRPIEGLASERVLVTTFLDGVPLDQVSDPSTLAALANRGADVLFTCASHGGAFNADLRAGNLLAMPGGSLGIVGFEDCCALDTATAEGLRQLLEAVARRDERLEVQALDALGAIPPEVDRRAVVARLAWLRQEKGDLWGRDPLYGLPHVFQALADFELTAPPPLLRLGEGILHLEAVCRRAGATPDLAARLPEPGPATGDHLGPLLTEEEIAAAALVPDVIGSGSFRDVFRLVPANFRPRKEHLVQQLPFLFILPVFLLYGLRWGLLVLVVQQLAAAGVTKLRGQTIGTGTKWVIGLATVFGVVGIVSGNQVVAFLPGLLPSLLLYPVLLGTFVAKRPVVGLLVNYLWPLPPAIRKDPALQRRIWILSTIQVALIIGRQVIAVYLLVTASAATYLTFRQLGNVVSSQANLPIIWLAKRGVAKAPEIEARLRVEAERSAS
jgi:hypothetical protein